MLLVSGNFLIGMAIIVVFSTIISKQPTAIKHLISNICLQRNSGNSNNEKWPLTRCWSPYFFIIPQRIIKVTVKHNKSHYCEF